MKGLLATVNFFELDIDVAIRVGIDGDVDDLAVLLVALSLNIFLELLGPVGTVFLQLTVNCVSMCETSRTTRVGYLLVRVKSVLNLDTL